MQRVSVSMYLGSRYFTKHTVISFLNGDCAVDNKDVLFVTDPSFVLRHHTNLIIKDTAHFLELCCVKTTSIVCLSIVDPPTVVQLGFFPIFLSVFGEFSLFNVRVKCFIDFKTPSGKFVICDIWLLTSNLTSHTVYKENNADVLIPLDTRTFSHFVDLLSVRKITFFL